MGLLGRGGAGLLAGIVATGLAALPGCTPTRAAQPAPPAPDVRQPDTGLPPGDAPAADPLALPEVLGLAADHAAAIEAYRAARARAADNPDALCAAMRAAEAVAASVGDRLAARRDELFDGDRYDAFIRAVDELSAALDGVAFAVGASAMYAHVTWAQLAGLGDATRPADASLRATGELLGAHYPAFIEQTWDLGGCARPERAIAPLGALAASLAAAPACVREVLAPALRAAIEQIGSLSCFCADRDAVAAAVARLAPVLRRLPDLGGPAAATALTAGTSAPTAQYEDACAN